MLAIFFIRKIGGAVVSLHALTLPVEKFIMHSIVMFMIFLFVGTGIFGAFFLLLLIVADLIPQAMTVSPKCGIYISANMRLVVFSLLLNALVTSIHNTSQDKPIWRRVKLVRTPFFKQFLEDISPFVEPLKPLFWISGDVCPGFKSQAGSLACFLACMIPKYTSGATPADSMEVSMAAEYFMGTLRVIQIQFCSKKFGLSKKNKKKSISQYFTFQMFS